MVAGRRMLVVSMIDRKLTRSDRDGLKTVADLSKLVPIMCNDMVVETRGGAYVGNPGYDLDVNEKPRTTMSVRARQMVSRAWWPRKRRSRMGC